MIEEPRRPRAIEGRFRALAAYGAAVALSALLTIWTLRLWEADLHVPLVYGGDGLFNQLWIKTLIDHGWYLRNDSVGAPAGLDMHDFPLVDSLFFALLKLIALATHHFGLTINLYYLLTFPLTALTALLALRRLGVSSPPALVAAVLFALLPYHFFRGQGHLFLASYFLIPPMTVVVLRVFLNRGALPEPGAGGAGAGQASGWEKPGLAAILTCVLMGSGGVYYAFFSCYLLLLAGLGASVRRRRLTPLVTAGLLGGIITLGVLANVAPKLIYDRQHGSNFEVARRVPYESEVYALRLVPMLMPAPGHRLGALSTLGNDLTKAFPTLQNEAGSAALGVTGSIGFLLLLGRPLVRGTPARPGPLDGLALLNMGTVLLALAGGLGTLFAFFVSPMIRGYNRISIFIAFFALAGLAVMAERLRACLARPRLRIAYHAALGLTLVGGVLDQTSPSFVPPYESRKQAYDNDAEYVGRLETALPRRAMVFQLPSVSFPEAPAVGGVSCYDHFRCYLHSRHLRWSHGAMNGRWGDSWRTRVAAETPEEMVQTLAFAGFSGIHVNRAGYADRARGLEAQLAQILGTGPTAVSRDGAYAFFPLTAYGARLRTQYSASEWAERRREALYPVAVNWSRGFYPEERAGDLAFHWSAGVSDLMLTNPDTRPQRVAVTMRCVAGVPGSWTLRIRGPLWKSRLRIDGSGRTMTRELVLPPGESWLHFACNGPPVPAPGDPRNFVFRVEGFTLSRLSSPPAPAEVGQGPDDSARR